MLQPRSAEFWCVHNFRNRDQLCVEKKVTGTKGRAQSTAYGETRRQAEDISRTRSFGSVTDGRGGVLQSIA